MLDASSGWSITNVAGGLQATRCLLLGRKWSAPMLDFGIFLTTL
jgi:hypothetical protein